MEVERIKKVTIYLAENQQLECRAACEVLLALFRDSGINSVVVIKGIAGFGSHRKIHTDKIELLAYDLPVIVEASGPSETMDSILPRIARMTGESVIAIQSGERIRHSGRSA